MVIYMFCPNGCACIVVYCLCDGIHCNIHYSREREFKALGDGCVCIYVRACMRIYLVWLCCSSPVCHKFCRRPFRYVYSRHNLDFPFYAKMIKAIPSHKINIMLYTLRWMFFFHYFTIIFPSRMCFHIEWIRILYSNSFLQILCVMMPISIWNLDFDAIKLQPFKKLIKIGFSIKCHIQNDHYVFA